MSSNVVSCAVIEIVLLSLVVVGTTMVSLYFISVVEEPSIDVVDDAMALSPCVVVVNTDVISLSVVVALVKLSRSKIVDSDKVVERFGSVERLGVAKHSSSEQIKKGKLYSTVN